MTFSYQTHGSMEVLYLTASLIDREGRRVTTRTQSVLIRSDIVVADGYELRYVAGGPGSALLGPMGIELIDDSSRALIANYGLSSIVSVDLDTGEIAPFSDLPTRPYDIARDPITGDFIVSMDDGFLARLDGSGTSLSNEWAQVDDARGIAIDEDGLLFVVSGNSMGLVVLPASSSEEDLESPFTLECQMPWEGSGRGVAIAPSETGRRSLLVTSTESSALYRCESDLDGGGDEGWLLSSDLPAHARYVAPLGDTDALVACQDNNSLVRLFEEPGSPGGDWQSEVVVSGFNGLFGLARLGEGRVLVTSFDEDILLELVLP